MDQPMLIILNEIVSPQILSLITKTQIRDLDTFKLPSTVLRHLPPHYRRHYQPNGLPLPSLLIHGWVGSRRIDVAS